MTLRQHIPCTCFSIVLALPSFLPLAAECQIQPVSTEIASIQQPDVHLQPADLHPANEISPELKGDLLTVRQRYLDAIDAYRQAPKDSAVVANKMGVAYHHMFDLTDAKLNYQRAIHLNPRYADAINNLGAIYHSEKNYKEAQRYYRRAIKLNPKSPLYYSNLGTAYFFEGNTRKGAEAYRRAFALDPEVFEHSNGARIEEASSVKDLAAVNYTLAKTYAQAGMNARALAYLRKALAEGFSDRKKLMNDPELAALRETPEFSKLMTLERTQ